MNVPGLRNDPFPAFSFLVSLIDSSSALGMVQTAINAVAAAGFSECTGLEGTLQVEDCIEGGENRFVHKFASRMTWSTLVLKRGITLGEDLWNWHLEYQMGRGKRRDGVIFLRNEEGVPVKNWVFKRGLPLKWSGPALNATQNAVAVETLEIAHEGLELVSPGVVIPKVLDAVLELF